MSSVDSGERIPNNVGLADDRTLQRALLHWQPRFHDWWLDVGPERSAQDQVYLRTAMSVEQDGWAQFGYVRMPDYRWGIFLNPARRFTVGEAGASFAGGGLGVAYDFLRLHVGRLRRVAQEGRDRDPGEHADDQDHDQQFGQREAVARTKVLSEAMPSGSAALLCAGGGAVRRVRLQQHHRASLLGWQSGCLGETPYFASPPHDGFAPSDLLNGG